MHDNESRLGRLGDLLALGVEPKRAAELAAGPELTGRRVSSTLGELAELVAPDGTVVATVPLADVLAAVRLSDVFGGRDG